MHIRDIDTDGYYVADQFSPDVVSGPHPTLAAAQADAREWNIAEDLHVIERYAQGGGMRRYNIHGSSGRQRIRIRSDA